MYAASLFRARVPEATAKALLCMDASDRNRFLPRCQFHRFFPHTSLPPGPPRAPPHQGRVTQGLSPCQDAAESPLRDLKSAPGSSRQALSSARPPSGSPDSMQARLPAHCAAAFHLKNSTDTALPAPWRDQFLPAPSALSHASVPLLFSVLADAPEPPPQSALQSS